MNSVIQFCTIKYKFCLVRKYKLRTNSSRSRKIKI